jgi:hypothetical protein
MKTIPIIIILLASVAIGLGFASYPIMEEEASAQSQRASERACPDGGQLEKGRCKLLIGAFDPSCPEGSEEAGISDPITGKKGIGCLDESGEAVELACLPPQGIPEGAIIELEGGPFLFRQGDVFAVCNVFETSRPGNGGNNNNGDN